MDAVAPNIDKQALQSVVEDAYKAFRRHARPAFPLDVCLNCCMDADLEREMREKPLRELTARHFYEYNTSAKGAEQPVAEILYLLPRMLELIAEDAEVHHSTELFLDRVGRCPTGTFDKAQRGVLDRFALCLFAQAIDAECTWGKEPFSLLLMFDIGGIDVAPLLSLWVASETPPSAVHYVRDTYWEFWPARDYDNAFAGDRPAFRAQLREWLLHPSNRRRFADKLMKPEFLALAARQGKMGCMPFNMMVDAVFDQLTQ
jgi:hypothetical protein